MTTSGNARATGPLVTTPRTIASQASPNHLRRNHGSAFDRVGSIGSAASKKATAATVVKSVSGASKLATRAKTISSIELEEETAASQAMRGPRRRQAKAVIHATKATPERSDGRRAASSE